MKNYSPAVGRTSFMLPGDAETSSSVFMGPL